METKNRNPSNVEGDTDVDLGLDLDIHNYSIRDLEHFFKLENNRHNYITADIELSQVKIREQLLSSGHVNKRFKRDLLQFLDNAKKQLLLHGRLRDDYQQPPTTIPVNFRLDPMPNIPNVYQDKTDSIGTTYSNIIYPSSSPPPLPPLPPLPSSYNRNVLEHEISVFPGTLNPIEKRTTNTSLCIDSVFRPNITTTNSYDFTYTLPKVMKNVISMKISSLEIPRMWYEFSTAKSNNIITIGVYNMSDYVDASYVIIIPDGNYTLNTLQLTINNIFGLVGGGINFLIMSVEPETLSVVIRVRNSMVDLRGNGVFFPYDNGDDHYSPDFWFSVDLQEGLDASIPIYKTLGWTLGFRKRNYIITKTNLFMAFQDSPYSVIPFVGHLMTETFFGSGYSNYIFLEIDDYNNNFKTDTIISSTGTSYLGKNILARIALSGGTSSIIIDNASDFVFKQRDYFGPVSLDRLRIRMLDRYGDPLNLNYSDFSFVLELTQLYTNIV
jgi:hypothetical protein